MINLSCIANILRKHHFTSVIITIWIQKNGESEILLSPDEPYAKHRQLFRILTGGYVDVVAWSRAYG